jgi:hypothetical protein
VGVEVCGAVVAGGGLVGAGVLAGIGVSVGCGVAVGLGVLVALAVGVCVGSGVSVGLSVGMGVGMFVGFKVAVGSGVLLGLGVSAGGSGMLVGSVSVWPVMAAVGVSVVQADKLAVVPSNKNRISGIEKHFIKDFIGSHLFCFQILAALWSMVTTGFFCIINDFERFQGVSDG